jgi:hypothetical protein
MTDKAELDKYRPMVNFGDVFRFLITNTGLAIFLIYATIATIGFIYSIVFYSHFDLNVVAYLEITDILVAGVKDPLVILMACGAFGVIAVAWLFVYIQAPFVAWLYKKVDKGFFKFIPKLFQSENPNTFWWYAIIIFVLYSHQFISLHSKNKYESIVEQKVGLVLVASEATKDSADQYSLLGTSINFVFLYNHQQKNTLIIPIENITSLQPALVE